MYIGNDADFNKYLLTIIPHHRQSVLGIVNSTLAEIKCVPFKLGVSPPNYKVIGSYLFASTTVACRAQDWFSCCNFQVVIYGHRTR